MGVSRKVNNIKIIKKSTISVQRDNIKNVVSAWNGLFDFPPLTPYNNPNSTFNIDALKKEDGSFYTVDELSEALRNYVGLDVLPFSFPTVLSFEPMRYELDKAKFNDSSHTANHIDFLDDVFRIETFDYDYQLDKSKIGAELQNGGVSARCNPFRGNKEYAEQMIVAGLLERKKTDSGIQYYLTPLGKSLNYLMRYYAGCTSANSPEFDKKINGIFDEMLTEKTYASKVYNDSLNPKSSYYVSAQSYKIDLDTQESIFFLHGHRGIHAGSAELFEDTLKFFDILIARTDKGKEENEKYNQGITAAVQEALQNESRRIQYLFPIPVHKKARAYQKIILDKINAVKNNNGKLLLEPVALEETNIYSVDTPVKNTLIFRSSVPNSNEVQYHHLELDELKKYLVANDLKYNDLELSVIPIDNVNNTGGTIAFNNEPIVIIKNKNNNELLGITNRIARSTVLGYTTYTLNDIYRTMNL